MKPLLKWAGGKRRLVGRIIDLLPNNIQNRDYHEPFFGGGAVFFQIEPISGSINDINPKLMNFYKVVRDKPNALIDEASNYVYDEKVYYHLRNRFNSSGLSDVDYAAILLYLNKTAYNGLYRVNSKGEFNVPFGRYKSPTIVNPKRISKASKLLKNIEINCGDYGYILDFVCKGSLCYLDPPYHPVSNTANFTDYSTQGFNEWDQERLRNICLELDKKGVIFVLSNSYTEKIMDLYKGHGFRIEILKTRRSISRNVSSRNSGIDLLITNYF